MTKVINRKIHKGCPFSETELMGFYDMLYNVNTACLCVNPPHPSWIAGSQMFEQICNEVNDEKEKPIPENP
mgnify:FL=1